MAALLVHETHFPSFGRRKALLVVPTWPFSLRVNSLPESAAGPSSMKISFGAYQELANVSVDSSI